MSALSQLREVMITLSNLVQDYDSDAVSMTSTVEEDGDPNYSTTGIIAECSDPVTPYLVSWEGYPLDQCTWEIPSNLDGTDLISRWTQLQQELGAAAFQRENEKNIEAFEKAKEKAEAVKERKHAKREQKRRRLMQRNRTVISDDGSSDEEIPLPARTRDSLFVGDQTPTLSVLQSPRKQQPAVVRVPPFEQSSSEEDSVSDNERTTHTKRVGQEDHQTLTNGPETITVPAKNDLAAAASATKSNAAVARKEAEAEIFSGIEKDITAATSAMSRTAVRDPNASNTMRAIRTAPQKKPSSAIAFVNETKEKQKRERSTDQQYSKVAWRWRAEKRSRTEAAPDFNALNFVGGPPSTLPKAVTTSPDEDNPYGRRESGSRRAQVYNQDEQPQPSLVEDPTPLTILEANKVPLTCFHWASSTCTRSAQECRFLHRRLDPNGRPYATSSYDGYVPPKYFKPPLTCAYWYRGRNCTKTAEQCSYAHEDTGWAELNGVRMEIAKLPPESLTPIVPCGGFGYVPPKLWDTPVTCFFWLTAPRGCKKSEAECKFAHWNTGWALSESDPKAPPIRIDPDLRPRDGPPKYADPPVTCPFWFRSDTGCKRTDDDCRYAHWNTGWAPPALSSDAAAPINPHELPRSQSSNRFTHNLLAAPMPSNSNIQSDINLTCTSWLRSPQGCPKSEDACEFAHRNTGWATPKDRPHDPPVALDPKQTPKFHRTVLTTDHVAPETDTSRITCFFWLKGPRGCRETAADCRYAHRNTGWLIDLSGEDNSRARAKPIDLTILPRFRKDDPTQTQKQKGQNRSAVQSPLDRADGSPVSETPYVTTTGEVQAPMLQHMQTPRVVQATSHEVQTTVPTISQIKSKIGEFWNLDFVQMFNSGVPDDNEMLQRQAMLLYDPKEYPEEVELITRWLLMHNVKVANLWYDGAWSQFREDVAKQKSGIIVVHPDFEHFVDLPGFGDLLKLRVRVWSVGLQPPAWFVQGVDPTPPNLQHDCVGVFPHGGFIYITDDVFEQKPQLAMSIVKLFFEKIERLRVLDGPDSWWLEVHDACLLWRLCVRPELMEYLFLKCKENSAELAAENPDFLSRADYQLLTYTDYVEQDCPDEPLSTFPDKYPILSERREIAEHPPLDYFNRLENSQDDANTHMIGYYAALLSADLRRSYRYFYVVHTEPKAACAQRWKSSVHNISDIITPEQCIEELSKPSKESLFDFLDWAMKPKTKQGTPEAGEAGLGDMPMDIDPQKDIQEVEHTAY